MNSSISAMPAFPAPTNDSPDSDNVTRPGAVSVIMVTHNSAAVLPAALRAVGAELNAQGQNRGEIIVVDNASQDDSLAVVRLAYPNAEVIYCDHNAGFARACNRGAERARGEFLLFLNPDTVIDCGAITALLTAWRKVENPGAVVGRMRYADGRFQPTCREAPTIANIFLSRGSLLSQLWGSSGYTHGDYAVTTPVPAASATMWLMPTSLFRSAGGFDPRFFVYMEDTDLSLRLSQTGKRIYFVPEAGATHAWGVGSNTPVWRRRLYHHVATHRYFLKHYPGGFSIVVLPLALTLNFVAGATRDALFFLARKFRPISPSNN